ARCSEGDPMQLRIFVVTKTKSAQAFVRRGAAHRRAAKRRGLVAMSLTAVLVAATAAADNNAAPAHYTGAMTSVDEAHGTFGDSISISVPAFHGIEPKLALSYNSNGGNGLAGVGWSLSGFETIERGQPHHGQPRYDATDVFYLNGELLIQCPTSGATSPSCTTSDGTGIGTYYFTQIESYRRIKYDSSGSGTWTIWDKNGTETTLTSVFQ